AAPPGMESYVWSFFDNTSGASFVGSNTDSTVLVNAGTGGSYGLMVTTGASGFTKSCQATVTVNAPVTANAGPDQTVCATSTQAQRAGSVTGGNGAWSGGAGSYSPNANTLNAIYTLTAAEVAAGGLKLALKCTPTSGPCGAASDTMQITFQKAATANA